MHRKNFQPPWRRPRSGFASGQPLVVRHRTPTPDEQRLDRYGSRSLKVEG